MDEIISGKKAAYVFDIPEAVGRVNYLRSMLPAGSRIIYAVKANPFIIQGLAECVDGFELCSPGEAEICDSLGVPAERTVISGVYKTPEFIERLIAGSDERLYTVESLNQFKLLSSIAVKYNKMLRLILRLTNDSQFGINRADIEHLIKASQGNECIHVAGIQFFSGTQKKSAKKIRREIAEVDSLLEELRKSCGYEADIFEYGPGLPVNSFVGEETDEAELLSVLSDALGEMHVKVEVSLELGRSIAASCGSYFTRIVDLKHNSGENYALVDGGMHHIVYFGQYMGMKSPHLYVVGKKDAESVTDYNICGALCSMNDILVKQAKLPDLEIGDVLCFGNAGAYCMTEGMSLFLSRELPAVWLRQPDGALKCVRGPIETWPLNKPEI